MSLTGPEAGVFATKLFAPVILMGWICCWDDKEGSESSSNDGELVRKPVIVRESTGRRSFDFFHIHKKTKASSVVSLHHLPSTSGSRRGPAHRSHEHLVSDPPSRHHHSAPSVIDEVTHRRSWERSNVELTIDDYITTIPLHASPESSSIATIHDKDFPPCKKHYTNIKSSKSKKESMETEERDFDATETFYIGTPNNDIVLNQSINNDLNINGRRAENNLYEYDHDEDTRRNGSNGPVNKVQNGKEVKQSVNESIKCKGRESEGEEDRSGARHRDFVEQTVEEIAPSVEAADYACSACYLESPAAPPAPLPAPASPRPRISSDGDILSAAGRPESGAFSESDLEPPPPPTPAPHFRELLHRNFTRDRKETAI